jgi:hypothetical protein
MSAHLRTKFEIKSWDEQPYRELPGGQKLTEARVGLVADTAELAAEASLTMPLHYRADGTSGHLSQMHIQGRLDGRTGTVMLHATGSYNGTTARGEMTVAPGSGTGELAGITGRAESTSTHADYPFMPLTLDYEVA